MRSSDRRRNIATPHRFEWTDLTYQESSRRDSTLLLVFPLVILLVFLVLAALYEA